MYKIHIVAYCWEKEAKVDLYFDSIKQAKYYNPTLIDFEARI